MQIGEVQAPAGRSSTEASATTGPRSKTPRRYAMISLDSTIRSNVTVGPPIDLLVYSKDELRVSRYRRFAAKDPDLLAVHAQWETALRKAVQELPLVRFGESGPGALTDGRSGGSRRVGRSRSC